MGAYLVIDDSPTVRLTLVAALRQIDPTGPQILEASTAEEAIERFREAEVDVVFLDLMMPGGPGGVQILRQILRSRPEAKVVLVTGLPRDAPAVAEGISMGAFAYVAKPVRVEAVRALLETVDAEEGRRTRIH